MPMHRVISIRQTGSYKSSLLAIFSSLLLLVACDNTAVQLCGEYACIAYQNDQSDCDHSHNCGQTLQCESAGSIRDRAPSIINQLRQAQRLCPSGLISTQAPALVWDETLASVSVSHTRDMASNQIESFVGSNGLSTTERVMQAGVSALDLSESITVGPQTASEAINNWLDINTDCQQLISSSTTRIGMACAVSSGSNGKPYWSVLLAGPEAP